MPTHIPAGAGFTRYRNLLQKRASSPAFHPHGGQEILDFGTAVFALQRVSPDGNQSMLCLHNVTSQPQKAAEYMLEPYQVLWIEA